MIDGLSPATAESRLAAAKERGGIIEADDGGSRTSLRLRTDTDEQALPLLLDIRDALAEIETGADTDVSATVDRIRDSLGQFDDRNQTAQDSLLTDIESQVNALRE